MTTHQGYKHHQKNRVTVESNHIRDHTRTSNMKCLLMSMNTRIHSTNLRFWVHQLRNSLHNKEKTKMVSTIILNRSSNKNESGWIKGNWSRAKLKLQDKMAKELYLKIIKTESSEVFKSPIHKCYIKESNNKEIRISAVVGI